MPERDLLQQAGPTAYSLVTYLWVLWLGVWGGLVRFLRQKVSEDKRIRLTDPRFWVELLVETMTSALVGVIAFFLCEVAGINPLGTAAVVAVAGHEGGRALQLIVKLVESRLKVS